MQVAAEIFPIRFVCGFGANVPDGVIALDDLFTAETLDPLPPAEERPLSAGSGRASRRRSPGTSAPTALSRSRAATPN